MRRILTTRTAARTLAFLLLAAAAAQAQISFDQQTLSTTAVSYQRQIGDLDGDGRGDVVGIDDTTLHWFPAPGFARAELLALDEGVHGRPLFRADDLRLQDMDGDGDLDAVTRIGDSGTVNGEVVWLENPRPDADVTGTWTVHAIGDADYVKDIVTADFDGDGAPDVAAREHTLTHVWLQDGGGAWSARAVPHVSNEGLDAGDLDGDGDPDLALNGFWLETPADPRSGSFAEHVIDDRWFTGQDGTWQVNISKVVVADVDGDGDQDVLLSHSELPGYPVSWYETDDPKNGPWVEHVVTPSFDLCHTLQAADFDRDGDMDVLAGAMADSNDRGLVLYLGDGGDGWTSVTLQSSGSYSAEIGDLQGDGDPDIADVRNYNQAPTEIRLNQASRPVGVEETPRRRGAVRAAPNPFNPSTEIRFTTPAAGDVSVRIHDARGRMLRILTAGRRDAGDHAVRWDGRDARGRPLPSGAYRAVVVHPGGAVTCGLSLVR